MTREHDEDAERKSPESRWAVISWAVLLAVAIAVYEIFSQPILLGGTISLKFAWGDFRTGMWIWKRDPNRARGQAHFWLYLGHGLWKSSLVAFLLGLVFVFVDAAMNGPMAKRPRNGNGNDLLVQVFAGSLLGSLGIALTATLSSSWAFFVAVRSHSRLWLNSQLAADRVLDRWPPQQPCNNRMRKNAGITFFLLGFTIYAVLSLALLATELHKQVVKELVICLYMIPLLAWPICTLSFRDWAYARAGAHTLEAVWPDDESEFEMREL